MYDFFQYKTHKIKIFFYLFNVHYPFKMGIIAWLLNETKKLNFNESVPTPLYTYCTRIVHFFCMHFHTKTTKGGNIHAGTEYKNSYFNRLQFYKDGNAL
ncbi:MAG: hypothetical protein A3K10_06040 [Bacteroidetes bacterium RIFCSPLOWO2_12_FULL_31_6]|nr:MAG: hypothetical protein A3K10_06040 [Bacteroidetes bacterium RIFCSPLOWO2_12_FULL_31_6]